VPHILSSSEFTSTKATLLILYDEGYTQCSSNTGGTGECLLRVFQWTSSEEGLQISPAGASHYFLSVNDRSRVGLSSLNSNDAGAPKPARSFWCLHEQLSSVDELHNFPLYSRGEQSVTFTATTTGGTAPYTITWSLADGATGTGGIHHPYLRQRTILHSNRKCDRLIYTSQTTTSSQTITVKTTHSRGGTCVSGIF